MTLNLTSSFAIHDIIRNELELEHLLNLQLSGITQMFGSGNSSKPFWFKKMFHRFEVPQTDKQVSPDVKPVCEKKTRRSFMNGLFLIIFFSPSGSHIYVYD